MLLLKKLKHYQLLHYNCLDVFFQYHQLQLLLRVFLNLILMLFLVMDLDQSLMNDNLLHLHHQLV
tara:strand:+ start:497 stop:691 length:195 start_codon:yes stop_codon:yes gene_type:complete